MPTTPLLTPVFVRPRSSRRQQLLYTREELRLLLNEDLRRERKARYALVALAERDRAAGRIGCRTLALQRLVGPHAAQIERILLDIGGRVDADVDELNAILGADRVLQPAWQAESIRRLHERARQLRTAGFSGLAKRMMRIVAEKQRVGNG